MTMTVLLLLLGLLSHGGAQLTFVQSGDVIKTTCDKSVRLPCRVLNLKEQNITSLSLDWKFKGKSFYSFSGSGSTLKKSPAFNSAELNLPELPKGDFSLNIMNADQAVEGKYTCNVTEWSRTGGSTFSLAYKKLNVFDIRVYVTIAVCLSLDLLFFWVHFVASALIVISERKPSGKVHSILAFVGIFPTVFIMVGLELLYTYEYSPTSLVGLGVAVIPSSLALFFLQFFLHPLSGRNDATILILTTLKAIEFVILLVGCGLCLSECLPKQTSLLLAGLISFTALMLAELVYSLATSLQPRKEPYRGIGASSSQVKPNENK